VGYRTLLVPSKALSLSTLTHIPMLTKGFQKVIPISYSWLYLTYMGKLILKAFQPQINAMTHGRQFLSQNSHWMYLKLDNKHFNTITVLLTIRWCIKSWTTFSLAFSHPSMPEGATNPLQGESTQLEEAVTFFFKPMPFKLFWLPPTVRSTFYVMT